MSKDILPPKNDVVFRLLFGDQRNGDLLRDFLQSALSLPEDDLSKITIVDPLLLRKHPDKKLGILDLKVKIKTGKIIHIEIQLSDFPQMRERIIFYDAGLIIDQIDEGENYGVIKKVITILIVNYSLIPECAGYHNCFKLYDRVSEIEFADLLEIHTLEIPKMPERENTNLWNWMRFLRAESKEELDMVAKASPIMKKAVVKLMKLSKDERARMLYEARVKQERDERARMLGAREEGITLGKTEGKVEGKVEGKKIGKIEGKREKAKEIARKLLKRNLPINDIMEDTGLSRKEIEKLRT